MKMVSNLERPFVQQIRHTLESVGNRKMYILMAIFFLASTFFLSQAVLFDAAVPFFLPIWALAQARFRKHLIYVFIGGMAGGAFLGLGQAVIYLLQLLLFNVVSKHPLTRKSIPLTVAGTIIVVQVLWQFIMYSGQPPVNVQLTIGFEAILALFMTFFLFVAFPHRERIFFGQWSPERLGAVCIVGIMATTGMGNLMVGPISTSGLLLHLTILLAASAGGLPFSTTIAMMIAAIAGVAELSFTGMMAVYGMTGFFAGALSRLGKLGIATGGFAVSVFFLLYDLTLPLDTSHFLTIGLATFLFFLIPTKKVEPITRMITPGQQDLSVKRQKWLTSRLDDQLSDFQQFAEFMSNLVNDRFASDDANATQPIPSICQSCFRYSKCWEGNGEGMPRLLYEWETTYSATKKAARHRVEERIKYKCIRSSGLIAELEEQAANHLLMGQLQHGRKMLALQLRDMSNHLEKIMNDIKGDLTVNHLAEEELGKHLQSQGIEFYQIDILSEEKGAYRIVISIPEKRSDFETDTTVAERLILPLLEEVYQEPFKVEKTSVLQDPFPHIQLIFSSAVRFSLEYGVVATAGGGTFHAGDAYEVFPIHDGLTAVLLSDGMGHDMNAYRESRKVIRLMRECLDRKMDPETAMHTLHYMMSLNGLDDMYATLDLALIDLQDGRLWSWKAGSMSTYIKRGQDFLRLDSKSVPVGFLPSFSVEAKNEELKSGDVIVMLTDGVFNGKVTIEKQEEALYGILEKYQHLSCEPLADRIMSEMERKFGVVADDRTVLVMKVDHVLPKWMTIKPVNRPISREKVLR
ncbi:SpoIIE family protein phosphatase [Sporosarcina thermotolerans]|uniref:SpoIIE family protein phosphatase n=2 Tax=Sporosarcina thermotolerans TaxID=633404 RepID=A0AAW9AGC6_9BACL|nr:SpoIIE family protein phosphatase [Sporosarcina thermotolerans]MDW0118708.1 SpoIIE family protein phosphatase [Sporosarcina thermotolerans]